MHGQQASFAQIKQPARKQADWPSCRVRFDSKPSQPPYSDVACDRSSQVATDPAVPHSHNTDFIEFALCTKALAKEGTLLTIVGTAGVQDVLGLVLHTQHEPS